MGKQMSNQNDSSPAEPTDGIFGEVSEMQKILENYKKLDEKCTQIIKKQRNRLKVKSGI